MIATNYSEVRNNLKAYCDKVVLMSEEEYNNLMENLYIRSNLKYYQKLVESIKEVEKGNVKEHDLIEVE